MKTGRNLRPRQAVARVDESSQSGVLEGIFPLLRASHALPGACGWQGGSCVWKLVLKLLSGGLRTGKLLGTVNCGIWLGS